MIRERVVAVRRARIGAVRPGHPEPRAQAVLAVGVIPARVDQLAFVVHARVPLGRFVVAQRRDVRAVGVHGEQRVGAHLQIAEAANVAAPPLRDERDAPVRQPARVEVVHVAVGQLRQLRAVHVDLEQVEDGPGREDPLVLAVGGPGEDDLPPVERQSGVANAPWSSLRPLSRPFCHDRVLEDVDQARRGLEVLEHVEPAAGQRVEAEVLGDEMPALDVRGAGIRAGRSLQTTRAPRTGARRSPAAGSGRPISRRSAQAPGRAPPLRRCPVSGRRRRLVLSSGRSHGPTRRGPGRDANCESQPSNASVRRKAVPSGPPSVSQTSACLS